MYEVMAVAGAVWSCPYAWKGPALVTLGREINENKWLGEQIGALKRGFVTLPPLKESRPLGLGLVGCSKWYSWTISWACFRLVTGSQESSETS